MGKTKENRKLRHGTEIVRDSIVDDYSSSTKNTNQSSSKNAVKNGRECSGSSGSNKSVPPSPPPSTALKSNTGSGVGKMRNAKKYKKNSTTLSSSDGLSITCAYCTYECNRQPHMKKHLFRRHPEMFFEPGIVSSLSSWKTEHLKSILMEIVFPNFILNNEISTSCSCSVCGKEFGKDKLISHNRDALKMHLLDHHLQEVREYLKDIMEQSDASLEENLDNIRKKSTSAKENKLVCKFCNKSFLPSSPSSKKGKHVCKFCNKSFARSDGVQRHEKYSCAKGERLPPPNAGVLLNCAYCTYEVAKFRQSDIKRHLMRAHPEMFFQSERSSSSSRWKEEHFKRIVKEIAFLKFILRKGKSTSCSLCRKKYTKGQFWRNHSEMNIHLIDKHLQEVKEHLRHVMGQSDKSLMDNFDLVSPKQKSKSNISRSSKEDEGVLMNVDESESCADDEDDEDHE